MTAPSDVLAALHRSYRRLSIAAGMAAGCASMLLPLAFAAERPRLHMILLAAGAGLYLVMKGLQLRRARHATAQMRLEEQFVAHEFSTDQFDRCLARTGHLWQHSRTLGVLRRILPHTAPDHMTDAVNRRKLSRLYRRAFAPLRFRRFGGGLPMALALAAGGALTAGALSSSGILVWGAALALPTLLVAEGQLFVERQHLAEDLKRLEHALGAWTLGAPLHHARRRRNGRGYRHTPIYEARSVTRSPQPAAHSL